MARWTVVIGAVLLLAYPLYTTGTPLEVLDKALGKNTLGGSTEAPLDNPLGLKSSLRDDVTQNSQEDDDGSMEDDTTTIPGTDSSESVEESDDDLDLEEVEGWVAKTLSKFFILLLRIWVLIKANADGILDDLNFDVPQISR
ncbi:unnamed protein product [Meganyctiphanes norvegica]|uniref:Uncharacterized protein n=1 Tax=Meganyctiphanes norvegica TaxID=48144 RepID=A0AAV2QYC5_MEGNR